MAWTVDESRRAYESLKHNICDLSRAFFEIKAQNAGYLYHKPTLTLDSSKKIKTLIWRLDEYMEVGEGEGIDISNYDERITTVTEKIDSGLPIAENELDLAQEYCVGLLDKIGKSNFQKWIQ